MSVFRTLEGDLDCGSQVTILIPFSLDGPSFKTMWECDPQKNRAYLANRASNRANRLCLMEYWKKHQSIFLHLFILAYWWWLCMLSRSYRCLQTKWSGGHRAAVTVVAIPWQPALLMWRAFQPPDCHCIHLWLFALSCTAATLLPVIVSCL